MADIFSKKKRSQIMSANRSKNTLPELAVRSFLRKAKIGYSTHAKKLPGKPDIILKNENIAIFVHGCFWHGHKSCKRLPKSNREFWRKKIENNIKRDARVARALRNIGWSVICIWECKIRSRKFEIKILKKLNSKS